MLWSQLHLCCSLDFIITFWNFTITCRMFWRLHTCLSDALETSPLPLWCSKDFTITVHLFWRLHNYLYIVLETWQLHFWYSEVFTMTSLLFWMLHNFLYDTLEISVTSLLLWRLRNYLLRIHKYCWCCGDFTITSLMFLRLYIYTSLTLCRPHISFLVVLETSQSLFWDFTIASRDALEDLKCDVLLES